MSEYTEKQLVVKMKLQEYDEILRKVELAYNTQMEGIRSEEQRIIKVIECMDVFNSESILEGIRTVTIRNQRDCEMKHSIAINNIKNEIRKLEEELVKRCLDV